MIASSWLLLAYLTSTEGDVASAEAGFFRLAGMTLSMTALIVGMCALLVGLGYGFYFLQTLPWRRRERAVVLLDLLEMGLKDGQSPEQTLMAVSGTRDRTLPVRLHLLAAHLGSGLPLADALARSPRLLPSAVQTLFELGTRHGVLPRLLPACRIALDEPPTPRVVAVQQIALFWVMSVAQCVVILGFLLTVVAPRLTAILTDMDGLKTDRLQPLLMAAGWVSAATVVLGGVLAWWLFARIGGPRLLEGTAARRWMVCDRLLWMVPWRRARMRRDFTAALAALLDAGVAESVAVREAALVTGSRVFQIRADHVTAALSRGVALGDALTVLDDAGELRWRLTNARHGRTGFLASLQGWLASLDTRAHLQEHTAAQGFVTLGILVQGLAVGLVVTALFSALVQLTEGAVNW